MPGPGSLKSSSARGAEPFGWRDPFFSRIFALAGSRFRMEREKNLGKDFVVTGRDVFIAALQIEEPAERSAYLDRECGGDAALRQRVEALLAALGQAGSFLQQPAAEPGVTSGGSSAGEEGDSPPAT